MPAAAAIQVNNLVKRYRNTSTNAVDWDALRGELSRVAAAFSGGGPFRVEAQGPAIHQLLRELSTPVTQVQTHSPSLEDAYLEMVGRDNEV